MSDEHYDFRSMADLTPAELWAATHSSCPRTIRRAERELAKRHRRALDRQAAQNRARVRFWFSRHAESIVAIAAISMIVIVIALTIYMVLTPTS